MWKTCVKARYIQDIFRDFESPLGAPFNVQSLDKRFLLHLGAIDSWVWAVLTVKAIGGGSGVKNDVWLY